MKEDEEEEAGEKSCGEQELGTPLSNHRRYTSLNCQLSTLLQVCVCVCVIV